MGNVKTSKWLRVVVTLTEDWSLVLSTHIGWHIAAYNVNSKGSDASPQWAHAWPGAYKHMEEYTHRCIHNK